MINGAIVGIVGLLACVLSVPAISETVWLKDVTKRFQSETRTLSDFDLPDQLTFHLRRASGSLNLNLKRNYDIDPNTEIFVVQKLKNGRSELAKTENMKKEDMAYYQDMANAAYMTVRCVKISDQQCERVIYGSIQIGHSIYELLPAETVVTSGDLLTLPGLHGIRYVLQDPGSTKPEHFVEYKDASNVQEKNVEEELLRPQRRLNEQDKQFLAPATTSYSQTVTDLRQRGATGENNHGKQKQRRSYNTDENGKTRNLKREYYVGVAVLIDQGIWDRYSSTVKTSYIEKKRGLVQRKIREAYSYIMNGVNLRYKAINDPGISITVTLTKFVIFERESLFPHKNSRVGIINGKKYIDVKKLLADLSDWDLETGSKLLPIFDHAMLFTGYDLYMDFPSNNKVQGMCETIGVCVVGKRVSIIQAGDYVRTVLLAAHELGHNLGADHDGEMRSRACKAEDLFIMTPSVPPTDPNKEYSGNPWLFSNCSLQSFRNILSFKQCVKDKGTVYNQSEWDSYMTKQPGEVYSFDAQCHHINGQYSDYCGTELKEICHLMRCKDPQTRICLPNYLYAARGTPCGQNMVQAATRYSATSTKLGKLQDVRVRR